MNSCVQVLRKIKELADDLKDFRGQFNNPNKSLAFIASLRDTYRMLEINGEVVRPLNLVVVPSAHEE
jgi:hypothetical protein